GRRGAGVFVGKEKGACEGQGGAVGWGVGRGDGPIPSGTVIEVVGGGIRVGRTGLTVNVSIFLEEMYAEGREEVIHGQFNFVAVDEHGKPTPLFDKPSLL
ncbi:hypothetical protein ACEE86_15375, partial [Proteus mirabilis]